MTSDSRLFSCEDRVGSKHVCCVLEKVKSHYWAKWKQKVLVLEIVNIRLKLPATLQTTACVIKKKFSARIDVMTSVFLATQHAVGNFFRQCKIYTADSFH